MAKKKETGLSALEIDTQLQPKAKEVSDIEEGKRKALLIRLPQSTHKQLRLLAVEEETTTQALMEHAINLLFVEKGRH
ncbi:MAG: ribbon-helix-helix domain-containing protein [Thiolinea sp.]